MNSVIVACLFAVALFDVIQTADDKILKNEKDNQEKEKDLIDKVDKTGSLYKNLVEPLQVFINKLEDLAVSAPSSADVKDILDDLQMVLNETPEAGGNLDKNDKNINEAEKKFRAAVEELHKNPENKEKRDALGFVLCHSAENLENKFDGKSEEASKIITFFKETLKCTVLEM